VTVAAQALMDFPIPDAVQTLSARDAILYALSTGYGALPVDPAHLRYIHERGLVAAPTLANVAAHGGPWMEATGVDWDRVVHAEHRLTLHRPIPIDSPLVSRSRWLSVVDRGPSGSMFATFERVIHDQVGDTPLATVIQTNACMGDGGCGSAGEAPPPLPPVPTRPADAIFKVDIADDAAALYRLNGDINAMHIDPAAARRAGFPRPLLHGLCTFGQAAYAISRSLATTGLADLTAIAARFSAACYPGETLAFHIWRTGDQVSFQAVVPSRDVVVLDRGVATLG
jgi:acyl dehydratase